MDTTIFSAKEASRILGISEAALADWRKKGRGPAFFKAGPRLLKYRKADLDEWISSRMQAQPTRLQTEATAA